MINQEDCNPIEGITKTVRETTDGFTTFGNDATSCGTVSAGVRSYDTIMSSGDLSSLKDYLARPVLWAAGELGASANVIQTRDINATSVLRSSLGGQNFDRLKGAVGLRATLKFTVTLTRSAFNQGVLASCFQYGVSAANNQLCRVLHFPLSTNLPHVRINIADETMMELEVPYLSMKEYWPIETGFGLTSHDYGTYGFVNLTGCRVVAGQDPPRYTIYLSLHDVELIGASFLDINSVNLQSGMDASKTASSVAGQGVVHGSKGSDIVATEKRESGLVSTGLTALAGVAGAVSKVPGLSTIGGSADWFLRAAAGSASAFGFSRPVDETIPTRVVRGAYAGDSQVDVPTIAFPLSAFGSHKLAINGAVGNTEEDQMQFDYILTKYCYIYRGFYATTAAPGDLIYACQVCPTSMWYRDRTLGVSAPTGNIALKSSNTSVENAFYPSTLCYLASNFKLWRGSFKFRVTFAKTKLHGGRVQMNFVPYTSNNATLTPLSNTVRVPSNLAPFGPVATGQSMIFDLQDASEFEFEVPYISQDPYSRTLTSIGDVSLVVVQPLRTNGVAPGVVDFMIEVCAQPGFEFAAPSPSMMQGIIRTGTPAITFQSGLEVGKMRDNASESIIGEKFMSVKQVAMQPDFFTYDLANAAIFRLDVEPWFKVNRISSAVPTAVNQVSLWFASRSGRMADMYSFVRGSTMSIVIKDKGSNQLTHSYKLRGQEGGVNSASFSSFYASENNALSSVYIPDSLESGRVVVPLYSRFARINQSTTSDWCGGNYSAPNSAVWDPACTTTVPQLTLRNTSGSTARVLIGRAAADDAMMSQFIGPPPVTILNSLSTVSPTYGYTPGTEF